MTIKVTIIPDYDYPIDSNVWFDDGNGTRTRSGVIGGRDGTKVVVCSLNMLDQLEEFTISYSKLDLAESAGTDYTMFDYIKEKMGKYKLENI